MMKGHCKHCACWDGPVENLIDADCQPFGYCHRRAPLPYVDAETEIIGRLFARTYDTDYCWEFTPKKEEMK